MRQIESGFAKIHAQNNRCVFGKQFVGRENLAFIEWEDSLYSVGIAKMDDQHKQLVALINALESNKQAANREYVEKILNTLIQYTIKHFGDEEKILKKINYIDFEGHHTQHQKFIERVEVAKKEFDKSASSVEVLRQLLNFLRQWLLQHILVHDKEYGKFLLS